MKSPTLNGHAAYVSPDAPVGIPAALARSCMDSETLKTISVRIASSSFLGTAENPAHPTHHPRLARKLANPLAALPYTLSARSYTRVVTVFLRAGLARSLAGFSCALAVHRRPFFFA